MIKKAIATVLLIVAVAAIIISSWNYTSSKIRIFPNKFGSSQGVEIQKREGYKINTMHPYEMVETDDGYDLIIHFVEE